MSSFSGVFVAVITPFKNDKIDFPAYRKIIQRCIYKGIDGIVPVGTTGEAPTLTDNEKFDLIKIAVEECKNQVPVIAGAGANSTSMAIKYGEIAKSAGATAHLQVVPYYNKPPQEGLIKHFETIADTIDLPMILYNVPSRTITKLEIQTIVELSKHKNILGIKEATGDINIVKELRKKVPEDFSILSGDDAINFGIYKAGGNGTISVIANVWPEETSNTWDLFQKGNLESSLESQNKQLALIEDLFFVTNPIPAKACMHLLGFCENELRLPLVPLNEKNMERLKKRLTECNLV